MDFEDFSLNICRDCAYAAPAPKREFVLCHRNPPIAVSNGNGKISVSFVPVSEYSWCGEWKERASIYESFIEVEASAV